MHLVASFDVIRSETYSGDLTYYKLWKENNGSCANQRALTDPWYVENSREFMKLPPGITDPNQHPFCGEKTCIQVEGRLGSIVVKVITMSMSLTRCFHILTIQTRVELKQLGSLSIAIKPAGKKMKKNVNF
jgi:hypothetical protein